MFYSCAFYNHGRSTFQLALRRPAKVYQRLGFQAKLL